MSSKNIRTVMREQFGFCDLDDYYKAYEGVVNLVGFDKLHMLLPVTDEEIIEAYKTDKHFNNIPIRKWDFAGGWITRGNDSIPMWGSSLPQILKKELGVTAISNSECVSILKTCARMIAKNAERKTA